MKLNIKKFFKFIFNKLFSDKNYFNYCNWKLDRKLSFFDIGARGGVTHPWVNATNEQINVTLFEPDVKEFNNLNWSGGIPSLSWILALVGLTSAELGFSSFSFFCSSFALFLIIWSQISLYLRMLSGSTFYGIAKKHGKF